MSKDTIILGIETSCDETAVAIVKNGTDILSNVVSSQIESHKRFGGVVPEIASRHHVEQITVVLEEAFQQAQVTWNKIDAIAVTEGPGLVGALLVGVNTRSEERRVGKECRYRWSTDHCRKTWR